MKKIPDVRYEIPDTNYALRLTLYDLRFTNIKMIKITYIKIAITFILMVSGLLSGVYAGKGPGSTSFEFLNIPVGAREIGMGSGTAIAHGPNAYWWNPAGLAYVERNSISLMYNQWFQGINQQRAGYTFRMKNRGAGAINISMLSVTDIKGYDWFGNETGSLNSKNYYISYTQGKIFTNTFLAGLTVKAIVEQLSDKSAFAAGVDIGFLVNPITGVWISGGIKNAGASGKFIEESGALPLSFFSGFGMRLNRFILLSSDVLFLDNELKYGAGIEFDLWDLVYFRGGWNNIPDVTDTFRMGAGWNWHNISIDYAYAPYGKLGNTHRLDLNIKYGRLPLIETIYLNARKLYKQEIYNRAWVEFNKVYSLSPGYKKIKNWLEKTKAHLDLQMP